VVHRPQPVLENDRGLGGPSGIDNIRDVSIGADPAGKAASESNASGYLAKLDALETTSGRRSRACRTIRPRIITAHNAFGYFADADGVTFFAAGRIGG
jgi:zinc/manganese transport system substrate-binding protein